MSSLIRLENITKTYRLVAEEIKVLKGIDLDIQQAEMTAIIGVSGSGKSTLMNIMGCLDHPTSGHYFFKEIDVAAFSALELASIRNLKIGFVFQSFFLLARKNALQNVMLPLFYRGISVEESKARAMNMLSKMGVDHLALHLPNQLSGGQQQRVAIARALVGDPDIILADEPTGALDSQTSHEVMSLLAELNQQEGRTIVIITHDKEVSRRCQRIVSIKDGRIVE